MGKYPLIIAVVARLDVCSIIYANLSIFTLLQGRGSHPVNLVQWQELSFLHPQIGDDGLKDIYQVLIQDYWPVLQPAGNEAATEDFERLAQLLQRDHRSMYAADPEFQRRWYSLLSTQNTQRARLVGSGWTAPDRIRRRRNVKEMA